MSTMLDTATAMPTMDFVLFIRVASRPRIALQQHLARLYEKSGGERYRRPRTGAADRRRQTGGVPQVRARAGGLDRTRLAIASCLDGIDRCVYALDFRPVKARGPLDFCPYLSGYSGPDD